MQRSSSDLNRLVAIPRSSSASSWTGSESPVQSPIQSSSSMGHFAHHVDFARPTMVKSDSADDPTMSSIPNVDPGAVAASGGAIYFSAGNVLHPGDDEDCEDEDSKNLTKKDIHTLNEQKRRDVIKTVKQEDQLESLQKEVKALEIMKESYEQMARAHQHTPAPDATQVPDHVKFLVFQSIADQLFQSFNSSISVTSFDTLSSCIISWLEEYCKPQSLREVVVGNLQRVNALNSSSVSYPTIPQPQQPTSSQSTLPPSGQQLLQRGPSS